MANRVAAPNLFAPNAPNWSLAQLDANAQAATGAINDSSLGATNGPLADTGSANNYSVACSFGTPSAYNNGMTVFFNPANSNTGASNLTVSPLGSLPIVSASGSALVGGEIVAGVTVGVVCDGSAFRIFSGPPASAITAVRLRSFSAVGNPSFECDQRNVGNLVASPANGAFALDRWIFNKTGTMVVSTQQQAASLPDVCVPATNFRITRAFLRLSVTTTQASLGASDTLYLSQMVEGPLWRELSNDVHSVSLLVRSSVASLSFGLALKDSPGTKTLTKLCTILSANTWTLITLPNLPVWPAGNFVITPGTVGYQLILCLAAGSSVISSANDTWQTANVNGALGQSNFAANASATFDLAFVQHEPGNQCTTLIDKPFSQNYDECLRYYQKTWGYATAVSTASVVGTRSGMTYAGNLGTAWGPFSFHKPMAKIPTMTFYNATTGAANSLLDSAAVSHGSPSATATLNEAGFAYVGFTTNTTSAMPVYVHYTADTGW